MASETYLSGTLLALVTCKQYRGRFGSLLQGDICVKFELLGTGTAS